MLVKDCMTRHPIMISPEALVTNAQQVMAENHIRHLPIVGDGKRLQGLITRQRLALKPDTIASLDVWEITRYLSNMKVKEVMLKPKDIITIDQDKTVERAARVMMDHKIGCLPVIEDKAIVVGILSEIDLLRSLQEMLGLPNEGIRVTVRMPDKGQNFANLMEVIAAQNWCVMGIGSFPARRNKGFYDVVLKIPDIDLETVKTVFNQVPEQQVIDIREVV